MDLNLLDPGLTRPAWWVERLVESDTSGYERFDSIVDGPRDDNSVLTACSMAISAFDEQLAGMTPPTDIDPSRIAMIRTTLGGLKKFRPAEKVSEDLAQIAREKFLERNEQARSVCIPPRLVPYAKGRVAQALGQFADLLAYAPPKFGPGAVGEKFDRFQRWERAGVLLAREGFQWRTQDWDYRDPSLVAPMIQSDGARLVAVAKDWNKARLITVEPCALSFLQQRSRWAMLASMHYNGETKKLLAPPENGPFEARRMGGSAISFDPVEDPQIRHRRLALQASLDGSLATLDLSDASDRISWASVASLFPSVVMAELDRCRSTSVKTPDKHHHELYMYAGMGNATTFVVETLLFWAVCHAIADYHRLGKRFVSVFGDDIVVDKRLAQVIMESQVFNDCGFAINQAKSFWRPETRFRESCGMYAYNGTDCTLTRIYGYRNTAKGVLGAADLIRRCTGSRPILASTVYAATRLPNVMGSPEGSACVDIPWEPYTVPRTRWRRRYQRSEMKCLSFIPHTQYRSARSTELLYARLAGALESERMTSRDRVYDRLVATSPRRGKLKERWLAAGSAVSCNEVAP